MVVTHSPSLCEIYDIKTEYMRDLMFWYNVKLHRCQTRVSFDRLWIYIGVKKKTECATLYNDFDTIINYKGVKRTYRFADAELGFDAIVNYKGVKQVCCFYEYIDGFDILWNSSADLTAVKWDMMIMYHL